MPVNITLFSPIRLGPYTLPNRMAMAPMTRNRAGEGNVPQPVNAEYYAQRASAGLIITEATQISPQGVGYPATPGIHSAAQVAGWRRVTDAVHAKGGRIFLQLWHVGRISHPSLQPNGATPVAPSAIKPSGKVYTYHGMQDYVTPHALALSELPGIIEDYRTAAQNALAAGFDGVEIHGANGYLLDQFLRDGSNKRTDAYGGSLANRARLMLEVTEAVSAVWGANRVGIRLSPLQPFNNMRDSNPEATFGYAVGQLTRFGLAYLHITEMGMEKPGAAGPAFDLGKLRKIWQGVYMTNSGYDLARASAALGANQADMVSFGVPFLANPDLPARFAKGA
ncbi:MAG: alkene reductase, partial [Betaproteobacteria bacterium]|nr:alkene reductase [Betaproteobacteria bacterium]